MFHILTYNDLLRIGDDEQKRKDFIQQVIREHKASADYKAAQDAEKYYDGENPTICEYEKLLYDAQGKAHRDMYTANHKIASSFFGNVVDQEVSYLLRNGITFERDETVKKLGKDIHRRVADALESAAVAGVSYGFWNNDHLEVFQFADTPNHPGFAPLLDENDGLLKAGVRYWQIDKNRPMHMTLYELDGVTEYVKDSNGNVQLLKEKKPYISEVEVRAETGEVVDVRSVGNYPSFPIVPLQYKKNGKSELQGKRNTLDALDLVTSNMVNNVDEGNLIYWVLTNCDGMDDLDDRKFMEQLRITHVVHAGGQDDENPKAEAHSIEAPFEGTDKAIERLEKRLYKDFRAFDEAAITAGNQTATAIVASYVPLDLKVDKVEDRVTDFLLEIMRLAGIEGDNPTYTRNRIINKNEETENILMGAEYYDSEYITKKLLTINGDADQYEAIRKRKESEEVSRFKEMETELKELKSSQNNPGENGEE